MNTELLNRINMNDVYVKEFINNATDEQMEFFDIAAKLLSNNNDMSVIFDYTDDEHLRLITNKLIEYKNSEFVQRLKNVKYIEDIKELVTIMPNDDVFDTLLTIIMLCISATIQNLLWHKRKEGAVYGSSYQKSNF